MTGDGQGKRTIALERTYRARADELWALWTTKLGFESWWGPEGFRVEVHVLQGRLGGELHYDMIANAPEQIAELERTGQPTKHVTRGRFSEFAPYNRLAITHRIDFVPRVTPYESTTRAEFFPSDDSVRTVITLEEMHDDEWTRMMTQGYLSQLTKLDRQLGALERPVGVIAPLGTSA